MALPIRRPGSGGGGGFLNNVSGVITAAVYEAGKTGTTKKGKPYSTYSVKLTIQADGAEPTNQFLNAGFLYGDNTISKDGSAITGKDNYFVSGDTEWGKFVISAFEGDGNRLPDSVGGDLRSLAFLVGVRATFKRTIDREATIAAGDRKLGVYAKTATEEQRFEAGKKKSKKDPTKSYAMDQLLIGEVLAVGAPVAAGKKATATKAVKAAPVAEASTVDTTEADATLQATLAMAGGQVERAKFSSAFIRYAASQKMTTDVREPLRKLIGSTEYLTGAEERGVIVLDDDSKSIILVAVDEVAA